MVYYVNSKGRMTEHTFIQPPALAKMSRKLRIPADVSVDFLQGVLQNAEYDLKFRIEVAKFLIDKSIQASNEAGKESIMRLMQEIKREEGKKSLEPPSTGSKVYVTNQIVDTSPKSTGTPDSFVDVGNLNKL